MPDLSQSEKFEIMFARMAWLEQQLTEQQHQITEQQKTIARLEVQTPQIEETSLEPAPARSGLTTTRRKMLGKLAAAMVAGAAASVLPGGEAQARVGIDLKADDGSRRIGAIVVPPGVALPTGTPAGVSGIKHGLVATDGYDTSFTLASLPGNGTGVFGKGSSYGLYGTAINYGVYGKGSDIGVFGDGYTGVYGYGTNTGVFGSAPSPGKAGSFSGNVQVTGSLSKGGGSFKIDHPLDPSNKYLYHSFVESPDMMNIYNGIATLDANGEAVVTLPDWFETLNRDFRYGLTNIGSDAPVYISQEVNNNSFKIKGGPAGHKVSWQLTGIRQDKWANAHRIPVEETKPANEKGLYLHPTLYGQSEDKSVSPKPPSSLEKPAPAPSAPSAPQTPSNQTKP